MQRMAATDDVEERVEILAVMARRGFRPATRGQGGARKFVPRTPGGRVGATAYMPPRGRSDLSCINCGKKGDHATKDCPEKQRDKGRRPCFNCGKEGHLAKDCPDKARRPIKALMDAPAAASPVPRLAAAMMVLLRPSAAHSRRSP